MWSAALLQVLLDQPALQGGMELVEGGWTLYKEAV